MKHIYYFIFSFIIFIHSFADINFLLENDLFAREKSDRSYTNGVKISYTTPERSISLFQWMYTPTDITIKENQPDDRPYAGWLGVEYVDFQKSRNNLRGTGVQVGVIGPLAFGEQTQTIAHKIFNGRDPKGWDNQIDNKFSLNFVWLYRQVLFRSPNQDIIFNSHNVLGNTLVQSGLSINHRTGRNIPRDFGTFQHEPILHSVQPNDYRLYLNTTLSARYVHDNFTITGHPDNNIELENFVYTFAIGPTFERGNWKIEYLHNFRTREFDTDNNIHIFGSINIIRRF